MQVLGRRAHQRVAPIGRACVAFKSQAEQGRRTGHSGVDALAFDD